MGNARRLGAVFWALGLVLMAALMPISPPTEAIGETGWAPAALVLLAGVALAYGLARTAWLASWERLLAVGYLSLASLSLLQWLAGGVGAPYERLYLLPVLFVAALHPLRRLALFMAAVGLALALPFLYGGWSGEAAASSAASYVAWWVIAAAAAVLMGGVRSQRLRLARERQHALEEARRDSLTGLGNRRAFEEVGPRELALARRSGLSLSLLLLDVTDFKRVNDDFGHLEGDRCLQALAVAIGAQLREPDICFRWGGDEFALILTGTDGTGARSLAERLRVAIAARCRLPDGRALEIRCGVAELTPEAGIGELLALADLGLRVATRAEESPPEAPTADSLG